MASTTTAEAAFLEWFKSNGGTVHPAVVLKEDCESMGRGAIAGEDIESDTLLFSIPRSILLTTATASLQSLLPPDAWSSLHGWTPLILSMMREYLRTSTWTPYFALLPTRFEALMHWTPEELEELRGSNVLNKVGREEADEEYEETVKPFVKAHEDVFGHADDYTAELFHRMGSLVLSRSFHVDAKEDDEDDEDSDEEDNEEEEEREDVADVAMVPFADLLNAKSGSDNARLFYEPLTLNMMSTHRIPAGAQIFNTYADPPNSDLLRRYGHVDEVNEADLVEIGLETVVDLVGAAAGLSEEEREARAEWLLEVGVDDTYSIETDYKLPDELVMAIRTFLLDETDYAKAQKKESPPKAKLDAVSAEWARKILNHRLSEYSTNIEEDEATLQDNSAVLSPRKRMALIVRLGEKRILRAARDKVEAEWPSPSPSSDKQSQQDKKRSRDGDAGGAKLSGKKTKVRR